MKKCDCQKVSIKFFLRSETQTKIFGCHFHRLTPREYLNLHLISLPMFRLHFVVNYGKISEHLWTPHRLNKFMAKERMGPLAPAIRMLWETTEKTWRRSFTLIAAVKRCGRFIITGKSVLYFKSSEKVKRFSDQLAGGFEFYFNRFG